MILWVRVKRRHIDQLAVWSAPDGVMYSNEISEAGVVGEVLKLEHPATLSATSILLHLSAHVLAAPHLLSPGLRAVFRQAQGLTTDRRSKSSYALSHV